MTLISKIIMANAGLTGLAVASWFTFEYHTPIDKAVYNLTDGNRQIAEEYWQDPKGLSIETVVNTNGYLEVYLMHESGWKKPIMRDGYSDNVGMLKALYDREIKGD
ncbi:hypothetical protein H6503_00130 [Candidatus Woesearchaeota archaeon]|nr:hypothetical protein [Candidatus Woesearchaeota archaeon]